MDRYIVSQDKWTNFSCWLIEKMGVDQFLKHITMSSMIGVERNERIIIQR